MIIKKPCLLILVSILLASCSAPASPAPAGSVPIEQDAIAKYLNQLSRFISPFSAYTPTNLLEFHLSPDGQWVLPDKTSFQLDVDTLDVTSVNKPDEIIRIPVESDVLKFTPNSNELHACGTGSKPWSPDSKAFVWNMGYQVELICPVLLIYDIRDPENPKTTIFKPSENKLPEFDGYPGNAVYLRTQWSTDNTKILVTFGPTFDAKSSYGWIIDRKGQVLKELSIGGYDTIFWREDQLIGIKNQREIWTIDPWQDTQERIYSAQNEIEMIEYKSSYKKVLLAEKGATIDYLVFDMNTKQVENRLVSNIPEGASIVDFDRVGIPTPLNYTGISFTSFQVFDWDAQILRTYEDKTFPIGWFSLANGFIVVDADAVLKIINP